MCQKCIEYGVKTDHTVETAEKNGIMQIIVKNVDGNKVTAWIYKDNLASNIALRRVSRKLHLYEVYFRDDLTGHTVRATINERTLNELLWFIVRLLGATEVRLIQDGV